MPPPNIEQPDIVLVAAGTSLGSFSTGAENGPSTMMEAGLAGVLATVARQIRELEVPDVSIAGSDVSGIRNAAQLIPWLAALRQLTTQVGPTEITIVLGGDHSVGVASLLATKTRHPDAVCIYIDAHPDCQAPETSPTGNLHGMPVRIACGQALSESFVGPYWHPSDVFMLGIKDIDLAEANWIQQADVPNATMDDVIGGGIGLIMDQIADWIAGRPVHVSYDIDAIDSLYAPGTGIRNQGGLSYREATYISRRLSRQRIVAVDLVEFNPRRDIDGQTCQLSLELLGHLFGARWDGYTRYLHTSR